MNLASDSPTQKSLRKRKPTAPATDDERKKQQGEFVTAAMLTDYRHSVHIVMYAKLVNKAGKAKQAGTDGARVFTDRKYRSY